MKVLITGGTGSLGRALLETNRRADLGWDVTVLSRDEVKQSELRAEFPNVRYLLGDVRDYEWLRIVMRDQEVVIHAAAYKQVPAAEVNAGEAIATNVIGSRNVAMAAVEMGVTRVIGVSTDKACAPINCYGETKALMEKLFQQANQWGPTQFNLVRYGNVLGSRGSVLPLFKKQIQHDFCVTITDPGMTRFWLTLDDAVELILEAMLIDSGGRGVILVPRAPASTMKTLAEAAIAIYNEGDFHIRTRVTGIRPGEKMHEQLVHSGESKHAAVVCCKDSTRYRVYPAYTRVIGSLPEGFEYTSKDALQLSVEQLSRMIVESAT